MSVHKKLTVKKPVKLIFAGGFLGSGKTTALAAVAKRVIGNGMRVGFITNDQSENLVDTIIVRQMLNELGVPVEEVVEGCFCCKFDELIDQIEKILEHRPQILMGEPVGSCTDFVAAVANPIKIHYRDMFQFAPFSTVVDPDRVRELLLEETETNFPEEVAYLFEKKGIVSVALEGTDLDALIEDAQQAGAGGLIWAVPADDGAGRAGQFRGPVAVHQRQCRGRLQGNDGALHPPQRRAENV